MKNQLLLLAVLIFAGIPSFVYSQKGKSGFALINKIADTSLIKKNISGSWRSETDRNNVVIFDKRKYSNLYKRKKVYSSVYYISGVKNDKDWSFRIKFPKGSGVEEF